uniref:TonB-dependent receptor plug domain-containing protein n=1 Tax=Ningiella ruwaisensis TaxID=2364274 RepID=UPI00109F931B|nr:TonB-dependent receptor [Ningiella ruwaisensis]
MYEYRVNIDNLSRQFIALACICFFLLITPNVYTYQSANPNLPQLASESEEAQVYDAQWFAEFSPVTAADMVRVIPGGQRIIQTPGNNEDASDLQSIRLLINGTIASSEESNLIDLLNEIPASKVARIVLVFQQDLSLIQSTSDPYIDIQLKQDSDSLQSAQTNWSLSFSKAKNHGISPGLRLSRTQTFSQSGLERDLRLTARIRPRDRYRLESINTFSPDMTLAEQESREIFRRGFRYQLGGSGAAEFDSDNRLRINLATLYEDTPETRYADRFEIERERTRLEKLDENFIRKQVNSSLEYRDDTFYDTQMRLLAAFEFNDSDETSDSFRLRDFVYNQTERRIVSDRSLLGSVAAQVTQDIDDDNRLRYLFNIEHQNLDSFLSRQDVDDNIFESLSDLNATQTQIEELRIEPDLRFRQRREQFRFGIELAWEFTKLTTVTDSGKTEKTNQFLKPTLNLETELDEQTNLRLRFTRSVNQLDFDDFRDTFTQLDDEIRRGNPDLKPEQEWVTSLQFVKRFTEKRGNIEVLGFYSRHRDKIERIAIEQESVVGNIGNATEWGLDADLSFQFNDKLITPLLELEYSWRKSSVVDPFLGISRQFSDQPRHTYQIGLQGNLPMVNAEFGVAYGAQSGAKRIEFDDQQHEFEDIGNLNLFIETRVSNDYQLTLSVNNLLNQTETRERQRYRGNIAGNVLREIELRQRISGRFLELTLDGRL